MKCNFGKYSLDRIHMKLNMLPSVVRISRIIPNPNSVCLNSFSIARQGILNHVTHRYPTYSSYRSFWNTLIRRKEAATATEELKSPPESEKPVDPAHEELLKAIEEFKQESEELKDKYTRALAENENIRRRMTKQVEEAKLFAVQKFCKDLLEVADVLGKATECVPKEEVTDSNPHLKNLYEGLTMTESVLKSVFNRHGLSSINPLNEKFDPNFHEALFEQEVEGKESGVVVVVSKAGYKLHERVIRPALVGVSK